MTKYYLLIITILLSCDMKNNLKEPIAEKIEKKLSIHGDTRIDEYYWLNQRGDKKVIDYLNAENSYRDLYMKDYKGLEEELFQEIKSRIKEDDSSVPYLDNISGSLVWVALILSIGGIIISWLVGIKLPGLEYNNHLLNHQISLDQPPQFSFSLV